MARKDDGRPRSPRATQPATGLPPGTTPEDAAAYAEIERAELRAIKAGGLPDDVKDIGAKLREKVGTPRYLSREECRDHVLLASYTAEAFKNGQIDHARTRGVEKKIFARMPEEDIYEDRSAISALDRLIVKEQLAWASRAMDKLPRSQREALTRHYLEGEAHKTIDAEMGAPAGSSKTNTHRALTKLRALMELDRDEQR